MRILVVLAMALLTCPSAVAERAPTKEDCFVREGSVNATMHGVQWYRRLERESGGSLYATQVRLSYDLNQDPDAGSEQRRFQGLAHGARFSVTFGHQFAHPRLRPAGVLLVVVRAGAYEVRRQLGAYPEVVIDGPILERMLGSDEALSIMLLGTGNQVLREERIGRAELLQIERTMRALTAEIEAHLRDPARYCPVDDDEIVLTSGRSAN